MQRAGLSGDPLWSTNEIGAELCEIDTRFGELSPRALFHTLDEAGALSHRIPERGSLEEAMEEPPAGARAEVRGRAIRELHPERERYSCSWDEIQDDFEGRFLDLGDPFATTAQWRDRPQILARPNTNAIGRQIQQGIEAYNAQDTTQAIALLTAAIEAANDVGAREDSALARFWCASAYHDACDLDEAERVLAPALAEEDGISPGTRIRVWTRHAVIQIERPAPLAEIEWTLDHGRAAARYAGGGTGQSRNALNESHLLGTRGKHGAAIRRAREALDQAMYDSVAFSIFSYLRRLFLFQLRAGRFSAANTTLANWRGRVGGNLASFPFGVGLAIAESALSLRLGRHHDALERAATALEHSANYRRHRTRVAACIAYLEAAAASGMLAGAEPVLQELHGWHGIPIGELRFELLCAEARLERARGNGSGDAYRAAREEAERIDSLLVCGRHGKEWQKRVREAG